MFKLALLIAGIVGVVWFVIGPKAILTGWYSIAPTPAPHNISLLNWNRYENWSLQFSISHPTTWVVSESTNEVIIASTRKGLSEETRKEHLRVSIERTSLEQDQTLQDYVDQATRDLKLESKKQIKFDNSVGFKIIEQSLSPANIPAIKVYLSKQNSVYIFSATPADSQLLSAFYQMVESFKIVI